MLDDHALICAAPKLWSSLLASVRKTETFVTFKTLLKTHLLLHANVDKTWKKWSGSISCIDFVDWLILILISTSWKGLWISLYTDDDCFPTSEIMQLTVNNMCGTIWSSFGQKHQYLVMCLHSEQEKYSTKWYYFLLMINAWLIWYLLRKSEIEGLKLCVLPF